MIKQYSSFLYLLSTDVIIKGLNLVLIVYFARNLSVDDFGTLSLLVTYYTYFLVFIEFGTSHLALKEIVNLNHDKRIEFITNVIVLKIFLSTISVFIFNILFFDKLDIEILVTFSTLLILSSFISDWYFKSLYKNKLLFKSYFYGLIGYLYLFLPYQLSIDDYFLIRLLILGTTVLFIVYFLIKDDNLDFRFFSLKFIRTEIIKKSFPIFISTIAVTIYYNSDVIMLSIYRNSFEVGIYSAYYKFVFIFLTFKAVIVGYVTPKLSYKYKNKEYNTLKLFVKKITKYAFLFIVLITIIIFTFYKSIIDNIFGEKYIVQGSEHLLLVLLLTILITYMYLLLPTIQIIIGNQKRFMFFTLYASIINVACNFYFIPLYGFVGASYSTLVSEIILFVLFLNSYLKFKKGIS